jgi:predicted ATP-dependent Lon-type protease
MKLIPTSAFKSSYVIHVSKDVAEIYAKKIEEMSSYENMDGVAVVINTTDKCAIVIPNNKPIKKIETELFKFADKNQKLKGSGFWGQWGFHEPSYTSNDGWIKI